MLALVGHLIASLCCSVAHAEFLAAGQVVVYAGAVMVLYIFVVAYIGGSDEPLRPEGGLISAFGPLFAVAIGIELCIAFVASGLKALDTQGADLPGGFGEPASIGELLRTTPGGLEAASYLLRWPQWAPCAARRRRGARGHAAGLHAAEDLSLTSPAPPARGDMEVRA